MLNHLKIFSNGCARSRLSAIHYETLNLKLKCTGTVPDKTTAKRVTR
jgi:hypothetical protein